MLSQLLAQETDAATNQRVPEEAAKRVHRRSTTRTRKNRCDTNITNSFLPSLQISLCLLVWLPLLWEQIFSSRQPLDFATAGGRGAKATRSGKGACPRTPPIALTAPLPLAAPGPNKTLNDTPVQGTVEAQENRQIAVWCKH